MLENVDVNLKIQYSFIYVLKIFISCPLIRMIHDVANNYNNIK